MIAKDIDPVLLGGSMLAARAAQAFATLEVATPRVISTIRELLRDKHRKWPIMRGIFQNFA